MRFPHPQRLALAAVALLALCLAFFLGRPADEDALIYGRFALHLAAGEGAVWNIGGEPVEGFSSPAWMALIALLTALGATPHVALRFLSMASGVAAILATHRLARSAGIPWGTALLGCGALAVNYWFLVWMQSGMETPLFAALLALALAQWLGFHRHSDTRGAYRTGILFALLALCRPEGILAPLFALSGDAWSARTRNARALWIRMAAPLVAIYGAYLLLRIIYFGAWTPNTSLKVYPLHFDRSVPQALAFAASIGGLALVPILWRLASGARSASHPTSLVAAGTHADAEPRQRWLLAAIALGTSFGFHFAVGGDYRPGLRYLVPALPALLVCALLEAPRLVAAAVRRFGRRPRGGGEDDRDTPLGARLAIAAIVVAAALPSVLPLARALAFTGLEARAVLARWQRPFDFQDWGNPTARWSAGHVPDGSLVAFGQMGRTPYLAALRGRRITFLDTVGWVSREVADIYRPADKVRHLARALARGSSLGQALADGRAEREHAFVELLLRRAPDFVLIEPHLMHAGVAALERDPRFLNRYRRLGDLESGPSIGVWQRGDLAPVPLRE